MSSKIAEVVGWRSWRVSNGFLVSCVEPFVWVPQTIVPGANDGFFAYKTEKEARESSYHEKGVLGPCQLWGHIVEHERGYRAEFAYPVKLYHLGDLSVYNLMGLEQYGVPVEAYHTTRVQLRAEAEQRATKAAMKYRRQQELRVINQQNREAIKRQAVREELLTPIPTLKEFMEKGQTTSFKLFELPNTLAGWDVVKHLRALVKPTGGRIWLMSRGGPRPSYQQAPLRNSPRMAVYLKSNLAGDTLMEPQVEIILGEMAADQELARLREHAKQDDGPLLLHGLPVR